jgi:hypothetical protein
MSSAPSGTKVTLVKRSDRATQAKMAITRLSNAYMQDGAKMASYLRYAQILFIVGSIVALLQLVNFNRVETRIFPTTVDGKLTTLPPPNRDIGNNTVLLWVMDALTLINTMGFHDFTLRMEEIRPLFTDRGWESFNRYMRGPQLNMPSIRSMLENDRLVLTPKFRRPPEVIRKGTVGGILTYDVRARVTITRDGINNIQDSAIYIIDINIERVPSEISSSGLAIARWRVTRER